VAVNCCVDPNPIDMELGAICNEESEGEEGCEGEEECDPEAPPQPQFSDANSNMAIKANVLFMILNLRNL